MKAQLTFLPARAIAGCIAIGLGALACIPAPLRSQTLDSLTRLALEAHPSVRAAQLAIEQADARAQSLLAWQAPSLAIDADMLPVNTPDPFTRGETMFMAEQAIPLFGQNHAMSDAAALEGDVAKADLEKARRMLRARIEREYYNIWLIDRRAMLATQNRKHAELLYKSAETQFVAGRSAQSELFKMTGEIESVAASEKEIAEERTEALARLNSLLARPAAAPVDLPDTLPATELAPFDTLAERIAANPALTRMEAMATAARAEASAEERMLKPMLMVRGGLAYMPQGHPLREADITSITGEHAGHEEHVAHNLSLAAGVTLTLPFAPWSRSGPEERAEAHRLEADQNLFERDAMRLDMIAMLRSAYSKASRALIRVRFYRQTQLPLLDKMFESTVSDYAAGRVPFASVIDAYHMRAMAYDEVYEQEMQYAMALSMITELTGGQQ